MGRLLRLRPRHGRGRPWEPAEDRPRPGRSKLRRPWRTSSRCPATASGPRSSPPPCGCSTRWGSSRTRSTLFGGAAIDAHGVPLTDATLDACRGADAVLLAAVGGPKWDSTEPGAPRPEQGLLGLRKGLGLFANLRPVRPVPALYDASPLKPRDRSRAPTCSSSASSRAASTSARRRARARKARDVCEYDTAEIERIARVAFEAARTRVTSVDKMNVLETSRLWREVVTRVHREEFPNVELEHQLVDSAAMKLDRRAAPLRRDPHGEHVRRHPQRRGGDAHRLARDAAERLARRRRPGRCSSPSTARRPTSPAAGSPTRWP